MTQLTETTVPVPANILKDFILTSFPKGHAMRVELDALRAAHRGEFSVPVPWFTLNSAVNQANPSYPGYKRDIEQFLAEYAPQEEVADPSEPYLKRLYDGTVSDSRDLRTIGFTSADFSNAWAVHRGKVFDTHHLSPFHEEFRSWLAKHDAELIEKLREELMAKLAADFSSKMDAAASAGVGPIVTVYSGHPFGPVDEHLAKVREIGGIESL